MKKNVIGIFAVLVVASACKSNKATTTSLPSEIITDAQLTAVKSRFPDATREELLKGHSVYTGACTKCHGTKDVTVYEEPKLLQIVDVMAKKASITDEEKQALIKFAVGVRATSK